jgi:hypothetical protein
MERSDKDQPATSPKEVGKPPDFRSRWAILDFLASQAILSFRVK